MFKSEAVPGLVLGILLTLVIPITQGIVALLTQTGMVALTYWQDVWIHLVFLCFGFLFAATGIAVAGISVGMQGARNWALLYCFGLGLPLLAWLATASIFPIKHADIVI